MALARALVLEPAILLLDEPLGAIDLKLRKEMQLELKALNKRLGITFVYVTHDQDEALTMSDRIAVMDQRRVVQVGTPAEIYEDPRTAFVARFIGESNFSMDRRPDGGRAKWIVSRRRSERSGCRITPRWATGSHSASRFVRSGWTSCGRDAVPAGENSLTAPCGTSSSGAKTHSRAREHRRRATS